MHITDDLLCRILSNEKPSKISILKWYICDSIVDIGDSHTSELSRLYVVYQKKNRIFNRTFLLKVPSKHPLYIIGSNYGIYCREYVVYTNILEEMYKLDGDRITPRLYYSDHKNSLMLKDLSQSGYKLEDRTKQLDYDQCTLVFKTLAKFHALSVKLNQSSKIPSNMKQFTWFTRLRDPKDMMRKFLKNACDQFFANVDPDLTKHFLRMKDTIMETCIEYDYSDNFPFCVLNHGDLWSGNVMFKNDKYGNLKKVKFVDFQHCFWTSPAFDILCFTLCSMQFEVYLKYFDILLEAYINTLNRILKFFRCNSVSCTIESIRSDMKELRHMGFLALIVGLPEFISSREDPLDYRLVPKDETNINFDVLNKVYVNEGYLVILKKWLRHYNEKGHF